MSIVRRDMFSGYYVIISEERAKRPMGFLPPERANADIELCPFCPGNEHITPDELYKDHEKWNIRSFPNKYPALTDNGSANESFEYDGKGFHEILVDTRDHNESFASFSEEKTYNVLRALKDRYEHYKNVSEYVQIFKNNGQKAGATQSHSHWQIVAGGFIPLTQLTIGENLYKHQKQTGRCLYCDYLKDELAANVRVIYENEMCAVIAPYASRFTYEAWIMPKMHYNDFSKLTNCELLNTANALNVLLKGLNNIFDNLCFNILFMDSPKSEHSQLYHWHIQVLPRLGTLAGYEFSTGSYINHIAPENAAKRIRSVLYCNAK